VSTPSPRSWSNTAVRRGSNEYPFLIDRYGISVIPITSVGLAHDVSNERVSSGVPKLDEMLGGPGYFRGTSVLITRTAGSGKTSLAAHFAESSCKRGERCLSSRSRNRSTRFLRNMRSIGIDLEPYVRSGLLEFHNARPTLYGLEMHLATMTPPFVTTRRSRWWSTPSRT
jgi:circadian clock protein KaiC